MSVSEPEPDSPAQVPGEGEEELTTTGRIVSSKCEWVVYMSGRVALFFALDRIHNPCTLEVA